MDVSRRDFMKLVGVTVASLSLTNCRVIPVTCYAPMPPSPYPTEPVTARERLRACWLRFGELAEETRQEAEAGNSDNVLGEQLITEHRLSLDDLVENGELGSEVADLVQEAYEAAVYHVWRSNALITCYEPVMVDYAPTSAGILVRQSEILGEIAVEGNLDPEILAQAQAALEHDLAYYDLTDEEVATLYDRLVTEWQGQQTAIPGFEELDLKITPEVKTAAQFIIDLLTVR
jgi:hypothetical protein